MLLAGLFGAVLSASASVAREIRSGTALAVLAKPVGRAQFLLAKYAGLAMALTVLTFVNCIAALLATRMAFDAYGDIDYPGPGQFFADALILAYGIGGLTNFFLRRPFVSDAVIGSGQSWRFWRLASCNSFRAKPGAWARITRGWTGGSFRRRP